MSEGAFQVRCRACGDYLIDCTAADLLEQSDAPAPKKYALSGALRAAAKQTPAVHIKDLHAERLVLRRRAIPRDKPYASILLLDYLNRRDGGGSLHIDGWISVAEVNSLEALHRWISRLKRFDLIEQRGDAHSSSIFLAITPNGEHFLHRVRTRRHHSSSRTATSPNRLTVESVGWYVSRLTVKNFKCFHGTHTIDFAHMNGNVSKWTFLVGENGVGKTTILQVLSALFPHFRDEDNAYQFRLPQLASDDLTRQLKKSGADSSVEVVFHQGPLGEPLRDPAVAGSATSLPPLDDYVSSLICLGDSTGVSWGDRFTYQSGFRNYFTLPYVFGFGASRVVGQASLSSKREQLESTAALFDPSLSLQSPEEWLLQADYAVRLAGGKASESYRLLTSLKTALLDILPDVRAIEVMPPDEHRERPWVGFQTEDGNIAYNDLSVGYQSVIAWVVDLGLQLVSRDPASVKPLEQRCVVLVDEIDLHLHPVWQRSITERLDRIFPNAQFIATTHSPLIIQGATKANLSLLYRSDDGVCVNNDVDAIQSWRVDQMLTSELFGLESARPADVAVLNAERNQILSKPELSEFDNTRLEAIDDKLATLEPPLEDIKLSVATQDLIKSLQSDI